LNDTKIFVEAAKKINNQNPLGSAAGYWDAWFWLDREYTTKLLWFAKVQNNSIYCAYSRWKFEYMTLQALSHVMLDLWKMANELLYFSSSEFDFFTLPEWFKTGSSIMPQKKNRDVIELVRGNTNIFLWYEFQIREVYKMLFIWYNRDFQLTKEPYIKAIDLLSDTLDVMTLVIDNLWVNTEKLEQAMTPELYATQEAYKLVKNGMSFREAYLEVWKKYV
jgi:argininosuccinate lyase